MKLSYSNNLQVDAFKKDGLNLGNKFLNFNYIIKLLRNFLCQSLAGTEGYYIRLNLKIYFLSSTVNINHTKEIFQLSGTSFLTNHFPDMFQLDTIISIQKVILPQLKQCWK